MTQDVSCKIPVNKTTLKELFPGKSLSIRKKGTAVQPDAVTLVIRGVPRGAQRDPSLASTYAKIDTVKQLCVYEGKPICF